jgi:hypothetical protein
VTALIHADDSHAEGFDEYGGLRPEYWEQQRLDLPRAACRISLNPLEQARQAVAEIAAHNDRFRADQIVVGAADESLVPILLQHLADAGTTGRWPIGQLLRQTSPWRLLAAVAAHLATAHEELPPDFDSLSELVRHPDCGAWIHQHLNQFGGSNDFRSRAHFWLAELDAYRTRHLQLTPGTFHGPRPRREIVAEICNAVHRLLTLLLPPETASPPTTAQFKSRHTLAVWAAGILRLFDAVYAGSEHPLPNGCDECRDALQQLHDQLTGLPEHILPRCSADQAIQLLLRQTADLQQSREIADDGIDLVGWLDLPLDDSPLLVLTGFNEGAVPQSMAGDAFLPDSLRTRLGLKDNRFRYARDACALHAILQSQRELVVTFGRTSASGDPLSPSRLWFACSPEEIRHRIAWFYAEEQPQAPPGSDTHTPDTAESSLTRSHSRFTIPAPVPQPAPAKIPVTAFREYISCPYRYHLHRELGLQAVSDDVREIDALAFGNLVHDVLKYFGESPLHNAHDPEAIQRLLIETLHRLAAEQYGRTRSATVNVQLRMLENRLIAFSSWQAAEARAGWRILYREKYIEDPDFTDIKGRRILLHGRIDRIDRHEKSGEYRVIDYKTSEKANSPKASHRRNDEWIDLQLPLYRRLARAAGLEGHMQLGYVHLPGDTSHVGFEQADWEESELQDAEMLASRLAADILDRRIPDVRVESTDRISDVYRICQDTVIDRRIPWLASAGDM